MSSLSASEYESRASQGGTAEAPRPTRSAEGRRARARDPPSLTFHSDGIHRKTKRRLPATAGAHKGDDTEPTWRGREPAPLEREHTRHVVTQADRNGAALSRRATPVTSLHHGRPSFGDRNVLPPIPKALEEVRPTVGSNEMIPRNVGGGGTELDEPGRVALGVRHDGPQVRVHVSRVEGPPAGSGPASGRGSEPPAVPPPSHVKQRVIIPFVGSRGADSESSAARIGAEDVLGDSGDGHTKVGVGEREQSRRSPKLAARYDPVKFPSSARTHKWPRIQRARAGSTT